MASLITGEGPHHRPDVTLLVIADYDSVSRQLKNLRYDDGMSVPTDRIAALAAEAKILPAIFDAEGDPLWLGRAARHASAGQRIVLAARDGGCANCAAPAEGGELHHIEWFSRGGPTDIDNLALLCERCHHRPNSETSYWAQSRQPRTAVRTLPPPAELRDQLLGAIQTTSHCCANAATTSSTTTAGNSTATTASSDCGRLRRAQPNPAPGTTATADPSVTTTRDPNAIPFCEPGPRTPQARRPQAPHRPPRSVGPNESP